jgi:hypothetical protein
MMLLSAGMTVDSLPMTQQIVNHLAENIDAIVSALPINQL